jgi:hypothetical protein
MVFGMIAAFVLEDVLGMDRILRTDYVQRNQRDASR